MEKFETKEKLRLNNGMSMIALVVTIIIMLILTGVALVLIVNEGLIETSEEVKEDNIVISEIEKIRLAYSACAMQLDSHNVPITLEEFKRELEEYEINIEVEKVEKSEVVNDKYFENMGITEVVTDINATGFAIIRYDATGNRYVIPLLETDQNAEKYNIIFDSNGQGSDAIVKEKVENEIFYIPTDITLERVGYEFGGWAQSPTSKTPLQVIDGETNSDVRLYAIWLIEEYKITLYEDETKTKIIDEIFYTYDTDEFRIENLTRTGEAFVGWKQANSENDATTNLYIKNQTGDKEYYGVWAEGRYIIDNSKYAYSLEHAIELASEGSLITVMRSGIIDTSSSIIINKAVTLDLGENNLEIQTTIKIGETGKLTVIGQDSAKGMGTLKYKDGITIDNQGILVLGEDSGTTGINKYAPTIEGLEIGINSKGIIEMYDGQVMGNLAIIGDNIITPEGYNAIATALENGKERVTLDNSGGSVARIGYRYYGTIESALEAVKDAEEDTSANKTQKIHISQNQTSDGADFGFDLSNGGLEPQELTAEQLENNSNILLGTYIKIDLSEYSSSDIFELELDSEGDAIPGNPSVKNMRTIYVSTNTLSDQYQVAEHQIYNSTEGYNKSELGKVYLEAGRVYYLHLEYQETNEAIKLENELRLNELTIKNEEYEIAETIKLNGETIIEKDVQSYMLKDVTTITLISSVSSNDPSGFDFGNKNIILELNGYVWKLNSSIINNGKLEIKDSKSTGSIQFTQSGAENSIKAGLINNGELLISAKIKSDGKNFVLIKNEKNSVFDLQENATLESKNPSTYGIYNYGNSTVKVSTGSRIECYDGIYSYGKSNVKIGKIDLVSNGVEIATFDMSNTEIIGYTRQSSIQSDLITFDNSTVNIDGTEINNMTNNDKVVINIVGSLIADNIYNTSSATVNLVKNMYIYERIVNQDNAKFTILDGSTTTIGYGIENIGNAIFEIIGGRVEFINNKIYKFDNKDNAQLIIGQEGGEPSVTNPEIIANNVAIRNAATLKIFDGIITGKGKAIEGAVTEIEYRKHLIRVVEGENEVAYLATLYVAKIGENKYETIEDAINSVPENQLAPTEIDIVERHINQQELIIADTKNIIIDLNGISLENAKTITNNGTLVITDSSSSKVGEIVYNNIGSGVTSGSGTTAISKDEFIGIVNNSNLTIDANIIMNGAHSRGISNEKDAELNIIGGKIAVLNTNSKAVLNNIGTVKMSGGTVLNDGNRTYAIFNMAKPYGTTQEGIVEISGGEVLSKTNSSLYEQKSYGVYSYGILNILGGSIGNIEGTKLVEVVYSWGELLFSDGHISGKIVNYGNGLITGGTVTTYDYDGTNDDYYALWVMYDKLTIRGGVFNGGLYNYGNPTKDVGVYFENGIIYGYVNNQYYTTFKMTGGTIDNSSSYSETLRAYNNTEVIVEGGEVISKGYTVTTNKNSTVTIGTKDGNMNIDSPKLKSKESSAIYSYDAVSKIYYYDGVSMAAHWTVPIKHTLEEVEEGYQMINDEYEGQNAAYLSALNVVEINGVGYPSVDAAIESIPNNSNEEVVIKVIVETIYDLDKSNLEFGNRNIVMDLNGKNWILHRTITNEGTLKIIDSTSSGSGTKSYMRYTASDAVGIENTGNLEINIKLENGKSNFKFVSNKENGIVTFNTGAYISEYTSSIVVYNEGNGIVNINGGYFFVGSIYGRVGKNIGDNAEINITGGELVAYTSYISEDQYRTLIENENGQINIEGGKFNTYGSYFVKNISTAGGTAELKIEDKYGLKITNNGTYSYINREQYISTVINSENSYFEIISGDLIPLTVKNQGEMIMEGGILTGRIYNTGNLEIDGGEIRGVKISGITNQPYIIENSETGTVTIEEGYINDTELGGINNKGSGVIEILEGRIDALQGIKNSETGTIIIGEEDGEVERAIPIISGETVGIENSNTSSLKFYDGTIRGKEESIEGTVTAIESGYTLIKDRNEYVETYLKSQNVAKIGTTEYKTLKAAIDSINTTNSVEIEIINYIFDTENINIIESDRNIIIDLNGHDIQLGKTIENSGSLEFKDSVGIGKLEFINEEYETRGINNNGALTININLESSKNKITIIDNQNSGVLNINDDAVITVLGSGARGIFNKNILNITGATVIVNGNQATGILNQKELNIEDILIEINSLVGDAYGINNNMHGVLNFNSGIINQEDSETPAIGIVSINESTVNINGGVINSEIENRSGNIKIESAQINDVITNQSNLEIKEGTLCSKYIINTSEGILKVTGGVIEATSNLSGIDNDEQGIVEISSGIVKGIEYGIKNSDVGEVIVLGGTIEGIGSNNKENGIGIYNSGYGKVELGQKDELVDITTPEITGKLYGTSNTESASMYFYDGIIRGKQSYTGSITNTEPGYRIDIRLTADGTGDYESILVSGGDDQIVALVYTVANERKEYLELENAFENLEDGDIINMQLSIELSETVLIIPEGISVTLNLNGKKLETSNLDAILDNRGTLNINNSEDFGIGVIESTNGIAIKNSGTLILGQESGGQETVSVITPYISGETIGIQTTGTFRFYDGIVKGITAVEGTVNNTPIGYEITTEQEYDKEVITLIEN